MKINHYLMFVLLLGNQQREKKQSTRMTRLNSKLRIKLAQVCLIPYRAIHVQKYFDWMKNEELLRLTGSEPLSLQEEKLNQISWRDDPNKCTFIITDLKGNLIGDVNCFLSINDDDANKKIGELNVMIAEKSYRHKGLGTEAIAGMIWYAKQSLNVSKFVAKITLDNEFSQNLFKTKFAFKEVGRSEAFKEITMESTNELDDKLKTIFAGKEPKVEDFPDLALEGLRARGKAAFEKQDFPNAIRIYDEAIALDGRDEIFRSNRSAARLRAGEVFGALSDATISLAISKDYIKGRHRLGNAWAALGYEDRAKEVYREATKAFPEQQKAFDEIAAKAAEKSIIRNPDVNMTPIIIETFKLAPKAADIEVLIELGESNNPQADRFGAILYLWDKLSGAERLAVYEECVRAGYAGSAAILPSAEAMQKAKTPAFPEATLAVDLSPKISQYVDSLGKESPLERVAALVLMFEGCSLSAREKVANLLLEVVKSCE
jgi:RimJ/RimL family protein N-acetyltransferase